MSDVEPNCELCGVRMCNASPAGKIINTDYGEKFVCHQCCEDLNSIPYVIVDNEKIYK